MVVLIDTETTGLDPKINHIWQVGALLTNPCFEIIEEYGAELISPEIEEDFLKNYDQLPNAAPLAQWSGRAMAHEQVLIALDTLASKATSVVAYNAEFDLGFIKARFPTTKLLELPWYCAMKDMKQNYKHKCWKLSHLALEYGVTVNPKVLHSALADIKLTAELLRASGTIINELIAYAHEPWAVLRAIVPPKWEDGGVGTDAAKKAGFSWEVPRGSDIKFDKCWVKRVKQSLVPEEMDKYSFTVRQIKEKT